MPHPYKRLKRNGKCIDRHRLVMEEIIGRKLESWEIVHHIDHNQSNDDPNNLILRTYKTHAKDHPHKYFPISEEGKKRISLAASGSRNARAILNEYKVLLIKKKLNEGGKVRALAREFNIDHKIVSDIKLEKTWKQVKFFASSPQKGDI